LRSRPALLIGLCLFSAAAVSWARDRVAGTLGLDDRHLALVHRIWPFLLFGCLAALAGHLYLQALRRREQPPRSHLLAGAIAIQLLAAPALPLTRVTCSPTWRMRASCTPAGTRTARARRISAIAIPVPLWSRRDGSTRRWCTVRSPRGRRLTPFLAGLSFRAARFLSRLVPHNRWRLPFGNLVLLVARRKCESIGEMPRNAVSA